MVTVLRMIREGIIRIIEGAATPIRDTTAVAVVINHLPEEGGPLLLRVSGGNITISSSSSKR